MFFNSYQFLLVFLPLVLVGFHALRTYCNMRFALHWLVAASLIFYCSLDGYNVLVLAGSVAVNHVIARYIGSRSQESRRPRTALAAGIAFNILLLAYFKYVGPQLHGSASFGIPLGISFFSVQQIAYLYCTYTEDPYHPKLSEYFLFVSFFPYIVAGPIVMKKDILGQYAASASQSGKMLLPAIALFSLGLFKKVVFADNISPLVGNVFDAAHRGDALSMFDAWAGALLYTIQLYFDFSGYSDMAAGLAGLFGIRLPRNFHSPLKAQSITEFWRRWHMSMTRFFTNFVYLPLAVTLMRLVVRRRIRGGLRIVLTQFVPLVVTFLLVGIWHGAGSNFLVFALMMGVALAVNHSWTKRGRIVLPRGMGWLMTMAIVVPGMVFDRADNMGAALAVLHAMAGLKTSSAASSSLTDPATALVWLAGLGFITLAAPNTHEIMARCPVVLDEVWETSKKWLGWLEWPKSQWGTVLAAAMFSTSVASITKAAQFIYYRF
jgi:alginate O-acetyltransferase complex protein AlgI